MRPSVCIVSSEFIFTNKNGGIGTAMSGLAIALAENDFPVTIFLTDSITTPHNVLNKAKETYSQHGITLEFLNAKDIRNEGGPIAAAGYTIPPAVYDRLKSRSFDIIHFNDTGGHGHLCIAAKRLGLAFQKTHIAVALHSPLQWINELNQTVPETMHALCTLQAERTTIAYGDTLWHPSRYLKAWLEENDFVLPQDKVNQQYVMPPLSGNKEENVDEELASSAQSSVQEIVFFGRLEERKGLRIFCDSIEKLDSELADKNISVAFLGRSVFIDGQSSTDWIKRRAVNWRVKTTVHSNFGQPEAIAYLKGGKRVAVMASPADNSPCTIYEAVNFRIPFLAAATGGIPELVHPDDHPRVLFEYDTEALTKCLRSAIKEPPRVVRPALSDAENRRCWLDLHKVWKSNATNLTSSGSELARDDGRELSILIDATSTNTQELSETLESLTSLSERIGLCFVCQSKQINQSEQPTRNFGLRTKFSNNPEKDLQRFLEESNSQAILVLEAGTHVDIPALLRHLPRKDLNSIDAILPAALIGEQKRIAAIGMGTMISFHAGPMPTGGMIVPAGRLEAVLAKNLPASDPVQALLDRFALAGTRTIASPEVVFHRGREMRQPTITPARISQYAANMNSNDAEALLAVAATTERQLGLTNLFRRIGTRIVVSRFGHFAPVIAKIWRSRGVLFKNRN